MAEKNYINAIYIKTVGQYDDLAVSFKVDDFVKEIQKIKNAKGYANILFKKRKEPSQYGHNHYAIQNTFQPKPQNTEDRVEYESKENPSVEENDDLPF